MYNLFRFLVRYYLFFLFVLLEVFSFYLIFQNNKYQQVAYINEANRLSGRVYSTYTGITDYFYLRSFSDSLVAENARLHAQLSDSKYYTGIDSIRKNDTIGKYIQSYEYLTARVIRNSVNQASNFIYLDKGKLQGIHKYMGVINSNGIVGQVANVTDHYCAVRSVLNKDSRVSARFIKNQFSGDLHWDGINSTTASMDNVPKHAPVKIGDTVVTSGFSELFPRNIMVGTVKKVKMEPDKDFLDITVSLATNFSSLDYVYVINNIHRNETQLLDSLTKEK